jgi:hypothetical protein
MRKLLAELSSKNEKKGIIDITPEWCLAAANHEDGGEISAGLPVAQEIDKLRSEIERLRMILKEVTTNGRWTDGEQCGEWAISKEVYDTAKE